MFFPVGGKGKQSDPCHVLNRKWVPVKAFASLKRRLQDLTLTSAKVEVLASYFQQVDFDNAAWALYLLIGPKLKRTMAPAQMKSLAMKLADIQPWLYEECAKAVGDAAETLALIVPESTNANRTPVSLNNCMQEIVPHLGQLQGEDQDDALTQAWQLFDIEERILLNKIVAGSFRSGLDRYVVERALALAYNLPSQVIGLRLEQTCEPTREAFRQLVSREFSDSDYDLSESDVQIKPEEFRAKAVLMYGERDGQGGFLTYTFGVWEEDALISIAKIPSTLPEMDTNELARFITDNTLERIGPIRTVPPVVVVELAFETVEVAKRRKSGIQLRDPRTIHWHRDLTPELADSLQWLKGLTEG